MSSRHSKYELESVPQDSPEDMDFCLHCPFIECGNCLSTTGGKKTGEFGLGSIEGFQKLNPPKHPEEWKGTKAIVFKYFVEGRTDKEMAKLSGIRRATITTARSDMGLPAIPEGDTLEHRKALVQRWLSK